MAPVARSYGLVNDSIEEHNVRDDEVLGSARLRERHAAGIKQIDAPPQFKVLCLIS